MAARAWGQLPIQSRAGVLNAAAQLLRGEREQLARTITLEMGKPLAEALAEVDKSAWNCEYVAEHAARWLADQEVNTNAALSYVAYRPLGVVLAILPWNFPVWQVFRCAASALMAGNAVVLKHAPNVPQCAAKVTDLLRRAGVPTGVFQDLVIPVERIAAVIQGPADFSRRIHWQPCSRRRCRGQRRSGLQEVDTGTGRIGPVHRAGGCRPRRGGGRRRARPVFELRPGVPGHQAFHCH